MQEIWKDIKNYEGIYQVSNLGNVRSLTHKVKTFNGFRTSKGQILKILKMNNGYCRVDLRLNQNHNYFLVHRLVAQEFIPNPNNYPCINHKDNNPLNNNVNNLEWCTQSYNVKYSYIHGNAKPTAGCFQKGNIPHNKRKINQYTKNGEFICSYQSIKEASDLTGINRCAINSCLAQNTKTSGGFIWKYAD